MTKISIEKSFDTFTPRDYLEEYYTRIGPENDSLLKFFAFAFKDIKEDSLMLEFGGGPTIYSLISPAKKVRQIHFTDFVSKNLDEVKRWKHDDPDSFDWSIFFKRTLEIEGIKNPTSVDIEDREDLLRRKLNKFLQCNAFAVDPLGPKFRNYYDIINVNFVPEGLTESKETWIQLMMNISSLLKKNGIIVMSVVKEATYWRSGSKFFPAVYLNEADIGLIGNKLNFSEIYIRSIKAEELNENSSAYEGYKGMMFVKLKRS